MELLDGERAGGEWKCIMLPDNHVVIRLFQIQELNHLTSKNKQIYFKKKKKIIIIPRTIYLIGAI
jgi:hypothetical protein